MVKLVKLKDETHKRLKKYGRFEDTYDDIINRILDLIEGKNKDLTGPNNNNKK
jgi:hypothetical protein